MPFKKLSLLTIILTVLLSASWAQGQVRGGGVEPIGGVERGSRISGDDDSGQSLRHAMDYMYGNCATTHLIIRTADFQDDVFGDSDEEVIARYQDWILRAVADDPEYTKVVGMIIEDIMEEKQEADPLFIQAMRTVIGLCQDGGEESQGVWL